MVSYFVPRGRFLIKAGNLRQVAHQRGPTTVQQKQTKWPMLLQFRQSFSTKSQQQQQQTLKEAPTTTTTTTTTFVQHQTRHGFKTKHSHNNNNTLGAIKHKQQQTVQEQRSAWRKWTGFLLRWAPMGLFVFGAIEWQLHKRKAERAAGPRTASEFQSKVYCSLPLRIISRCWGWLAACYIPVSMRPYVYGWYSNAFNVNLDEALYTDPKHYNSIAEFFTRSLRDGVRPIDQQAPLVSPADGRVLHFGSASNSLIEQVKGVNYHIQAFLGPPSWVSGASETAEDGDYAESIKEKRDGSTELYQCVIYLAPGDYHRFHSAADWKPTVRRHFAGELLSVSPKIATWLPGLFCLNERAVYLGHWQYGFFSYTAVGATNVGSVEIFMDDQLKTNRWIGLKVGTHKKYHEFDELRLVNDKTDVLKKGDLVGQFNMGSTIVLLFEAPKDFQFQIEAGQKIRVGEPLGAVAAK